MVKTLVVITGPTGVGKTKTAIAAARHFNSEIISADSRQIFRELRIGTAVPAREELNQIPHHFIHSHSIHDSYNASRFETEAMEKITGLFSRYDLLILAGGSMLYIDAVCKGIDNMPDVDPALRTVLKQRFETEGIENLRFELKKLDPVYYQAVDLKNPNRIIHALEICMMTGRPYSSFRSNKKKKRPFSILKIGLDCDRATLHEKINKRVDQMIRDGLEEEARSVFQFRNLQSLNTVGYRELFAYFEGKQSLETAIELIKRNSRRYARKQLTWYRNDPDFKWFEPENIQAVISYIEKKTAN